MNSAPLIVYGAGGHGEVVLDIVLSAARRVSYLVDDGNPGKEIFGLKITRPGDVLWHELGSFDFLVAVGNNYSRERIFNHLCALGGTPITLVHGFSSVSSRARLGRGVVVCAGAIINACAVIGDNSIINTSVTVDHDCEIAAHVHVCPGARLAGGVGVGTRSMIGMGSVVLPNVVIGPDAILGAGSVLNRHLKPNVVAWGVPARPRRANRPSDANVLH